MLILKWVSFHFYCFEKKGNIQTMFEHFLNYPLPQTISRAYFLTTLVLMSQIQEISDLLCQASSSVSRIQRQRSSLMPTSESSSATPPSGAKKKSEKEAANKSQDAGTTMMWSRGTAWKLNIRSQTIP